MRGVSELPRIAAPATNAQIQAPLDHFTMRAAIVKLSLATGKRNQAQTKSSLL
jgi:hypothetical protein